ncbi:MAG: type IV pilus secretin PilQ [Magnetococcales bacterium]|nr:type IV pilus secretin PilQ [Magnetococcales bacterium]
MNWMRTVRHLLCFILLWVVITSTTGALLAISHAADAVAVDSSEIGLIERVESSSTSNGTTFQIIGNRPLRYRIFNLTDPPRLLLLIAKAHLGPMVQPMLMDSTDVASMFPSPMENGEARLEINLKRNLSHDVVADGNRILLTVLSPTRVSAPQPEAQDLEIAVMDRNTIVQLKGVGSGPAPKVFKWLTPPRVVMDLDGFKGPSVNKTQTVSSPEVESATLVANADKARLIVTLKSPDIRYELVSRNGLPALTFSQPLLNLGQTSGQPPQVEDISFERDGENAVIRIVTSPRNSGLQSSRIDANLKLALPNIQLPQRLVRRMDVTQFASPVNAIDTTAKNNIVHMVVRLNHPAALHEIVETPKEILIRVRPHKTATSDGGNQKFDYTGKKISMDFKDINIHNALKLIADVSQLNIILADSVTGTLTMRLVDVPWDQALDLILAAKGLGKEVQGNVVRIAPLAEIQASAEAQRKALASQQQLEPFVTELIPVSFANAADIANLLKEGVNNDKQGTRILSAGGAISLDTRTSTLIIKDIASNIAAIRELIAKLDKPTAQVLIEARIVEVKRSIQDKLGINWGVTYKPFKSRDFIISDTAANAIAAPTATTPNIPQMVSLGLSSGSTGKVGLHLGTLSPLLDLDIELSSLELTGKAKTISSPRVLTMDNQQASITQGDQIPYSTESSSGGTTISFIEASLKLQVTPHVTPNGYIALKVSVSNNSIGSSSSPPPINTKEVSTQALVRNDETIVLGGIFTKSQASDISAVPGLNKIPLIGELLFSNSSDLSTQNELLIFITPRVVQTGAS